MNAPQKIDHSSAQLLEVDAWNKLARTRAGDLDAGTDTTFIHVTQPHTLALLGNISGLNILDAGCGTGRFTHTLAQTARQIIGLDPSHISAQLAQEHNKPHTNVHIEHTRIQDYTSLDPFDAAVALLVLQDVIDLNSFLASIRRNLQPGAKFVAAITHPEHWPTYWGYDQAEWFNKEEETYISAEFRTTHASTHTRTLHIHRPISAYLKAFADNNLPVTHTSEPLPGPASEQQWDTPHLLFLVAQAT